MLTASQAAFQTGRLRWTEKHKRFVIHDENPLLSYFFLKTNTVQWQKSVKEDPADLNAANIFWATRGSEPLPTLPSSFYSITSSAGRRRSLYKLSGRWSVPRCLLTHGGLLHCRLRERMPPPHVLEQEPNFDQEPQLPSCPWGSWLDLQMQWPLKHHCSDERQERKRHNGESLYSLFELWQTLEGNTECNSFPYLSWCTLCAIHRGALFSFTEILVVRVTAPKLLAGVVSSKLKGEKKCKIVTNDFIS